MSGSQRNNAGETRRKTIGRPFRIGNSGRPVGARHKVTRAVEALLGREHEALTRIAIDRALEGDMVALRLCLERIAPPPRDAPVAFALPPVRSAQDAVAASEALIAAVGAGEVTPDEARRVMILLVGHKSMIEAGDLERRIVALENSGN